MDSGRAFVEFYVSCAPQLLPRGVDFVVASAAKAFTNNEVIELLYEPDIPWFKAITDRAHQLPVTEFIRRLLTAIAHKDSEPVGTYRSNPTDNRDLQSLNDEFDVEILAGNLGVLISSCLQNEADKDDRAFDAHRYPCNMRDLKYRAVWRGLELMDGWTLDHLFTVLKLGWKHAGAPTCLADLEKLIGCRISHNLAANLLYLGSNVHLTVVEKALIALNAFVRIAVNGRNRREHMILTEGSGPFQVAYKWLSHTGQDRTTYVHGNKDSLKDEYGRLRMAVTLRANNTRYPFRGENTPGGSKIITPFDGYRYPKKQPAAVQGLFEQISKAQGYGVRKFPEVKDDSVEVLREETSPLDLGPVAALDSNDKLRDARSVTHTLARHEHLETPQNAVAVAGELAKPASGDTSIPIESPTLYAHKSFVENWRDAVGRAAAQDVREIWQPTGSQEELFSFDELDKQAPGSEREDGSELLAAFLYGNKVSSTSRTQPASDSMALANHFDDLLCLDSDLRNAARDLSSKVIENQDFFDAKIDPGEQPQQPAISPQRAKGHSGYLHGYLGTQKQDLSLLDSDNPPMAPYLSGVVTKPSFEVQDASAGYNDANSPGEDLIDFGLRLDGPIVGHPTLNKRTDCIKNPLFTTDSTPGSWNLSADVLGSVASDVVKTSSRQPRMSSGTVQESTLFSEQKASTTENSVTVESSKQTAQETGTTMDGNLVLAKARTKDLAGVLQLTPGNVSIKLNFGRFYLKNLSHSQVDVGEGPYWKVEDMLESLNANDLPPQCLGFSTILSTRGADADDLAELQPPKEEKWSLCNTRVSYELTCSIQGEDDFVVEVDAQTHEYDCRGLKKDVAHLYLHCVQLPWDMQVGISQSTCLTRSAAHVSIGRALVASLCVGADDKSQVVVETTADTKLKATVDDINIRHIAQYRHQETGGSMLSLTMVKRLVPTKIQKNRTKWSMARQHGKGAPSLFYEASISSVRAEEMLAENRGMKLGEEASWNCHELEREGVFGDICRPAFGMITHMNHIGLLNDNGLGTKGANTLHDSLAESKERDGIVLFW